jgi:hypothetical protein
MLFQLQQNAISMQIQNMPQRQFNPFNLSYKNEAQKLDE